MCGINAKGVMEHTPGMNNLMQVVSPCLHFGDGLDGYLFCHVCNKVIGTFEKGRIVPNGA